MSQATGAARLKTLRHTGEGTGHTFGQAYDLGGVSRHVDIHRIAGSPHSDSFLGIYLPRDKLLIEADAYTLAAPNTPSPAVGNLNNLNLIADTERLRSRRRSHPAAVGAVRCCAEQATQRH